MDSLLRHLGRQWIGLLALLLVLGSGTAYAAHHVKLAKNSVASKQVKNGSLTGTDLKDQSVGSADLAAGSVSGATVADGSLTRADLAAGAVPTVPTVLEVTRSFSSGGYISVLVVPGLGTLDVDCESANKSLRLNIPAGIPFQAVTTHSDPSAAGPTGQGTFGSNGSSPSSIPVGGAYTSLDAKFYVSTTTVRAQISVYVGLYSVGSCPVHAEAVAVAP